MSPPDSETPSVVDPDDFFEECPVCDHKHPSEVATCAECCFSFASFEEEEDETPSETASGEATPGEATPGEATPGEATPGEATPGEALALEGAIEPGVYRCSRCGHLDLANFARCEACCRTGTARAVLRRPRPPASLSARKPKAGVPIAIGKVLVAEAPRLPCDPRGWGALPARGSVTLVTAAPGGGKSTWLLGVLSSLIGTGEKPLYIASEEDVAPIAARALRCGYSPDLHVVRVHTMRDVRKALKKFKPTAYVVDSINELVDDADVNGGLVREVKALLRWTQKRSATGILIGHINKQDTLSGPQRIVHDVDATVHISVGDDEARTIYGQKCRYGRTGYYARYRMVENGIEFLPDESAKKKKKRKP